MTRQYPNTSTDPAAHNLAQIGPDPQIGQPVTLAYGRAGYISGSIVRVTPRRVRIHWIAKNTGRMYGRWEARP